MRSKALLDRGLGVAQMVDSFVRIVEALAKLAHEFMWPLVAIIIVWWFRKPLVHFFGSIREGSIKLGMLELQMKQAAAEAATTAEIEKEAGTAHTISFASGSGKSQRLVDWLMHVPLNELSGRKVLWVDDHPENNALEVQSLNSLGIEVTVAESTADAMRALQGNEFDVVISDMARHDDDQAGYALLEKIRMLRPTTPLIIYSSSHTADQARSIVSSGAYGSTSKASELVELVVSAIGGKEYTRWSRSRAVQQMRMLRKPWLKR
jgi:CheY-like chemotaxis protein